MKKPFLLLQYRLLSRVADNEAQSIIRKGGLQGRIEVIRMDQNPDTPIELNRYAGVLMGGSPFNISDPGEKKSAVQKAAERHSIRLMQEIMERDFPYLGICYGLGMLSSCSQGIVSKEKYGEEVGITKIYLTEEGRKDPITRGIPDVFHAIVGHKEACQIVPPGSTLLAGSKQCPTQLVRYKQNVYATQFHPELDTEGIHIRAEVY